MDLTKILTIMKTIYSLLKFAKRVKKELDETQTDESNTKPKDIPKEHGSSHSEQTKSA